MQDAIAAIRERLDAGPAVRHRLVPVLAGDVVTACQGLPAGKQSAASQALLKGASASPPHAEVLQQYGDLLALVESAA